MKLKSLFIAVTLSLLTANSYSAEVSTDTLVKVLSIWTKNGDLLLQTDPRPLLPPGCSKDFWLVMKNGDLGYQATLAMLLSAQAQNKPITVTASDSFVTSDGFFCGLTRVTIR